MGLADVLKKSFNGEPLVDHGGIVSFKDFDILGEADKLLTSVRKVPVPTVNTQYRASAMARLCPREEVICNLKNIERTSKIEASLQRTFDFGHAFHSLVQNEWFGKWGWLVGTWECSGKKCPAVYRNQARPKKCLECGGEKFHYEEFEFINEEYNIIGHVDCPIEVGGQRKLIELKTCNSKVFDFLTNIRRDALEGHKDQINIYMWLSKIHFGGVIYFDKDESRWHQFPQHFDQARMSKILQRVVDAREGIKSKVVPPRTVCAKKDCSRAKSCSVRNICFEK